MWLFQIQEDHDYSEAGPSTLPHSKRIEIRQTQETTSTNQSGRSLRVRTPRNTPSNVYIDGDSDDDEPLHRLVTETPNRTSGRACRQNPRYSDEHTSQSQSTSSRSVTTSSSTLSMRTCRTQKRPLYHENSDDVDSDDVWRSAKRTTTRRRFVFFTEYFNASTNKSTKKKIEMFIC